MWLSRRLRSTTLQKVDSSSAWDLGIDPKSEAFGTSLAHRAARNSEALALMVRLWTEDEVTHHGRFFHVTNARPTAKPYQQPYPKIWLAAMSDPAVRRVGREGYTMFVGPAQPFETIRRQIDLYHQELEDHGHSRPDDMVIVREFFSAEITEAGLWSGPGVALRPSTWFTVSTDSRALMKS